MLDVSALCRTCMKENVPLVDLYEPVKIEENCFQLVELLVLCTATEVSKEDGLPQKLCDECTRVVQLAYAFRNQAERSQEEFKKLLQKDIKKESLEIEVKTEFEDDYGNTFDEISVTEDVTKTDVEEKSHACRICNKTFTKEKKFLKHLQSHESSLQCPVCNKLYHSQTYLDKHLSKHLNYSCLVCNQNFVTEEQLASHSSEHTLNNGAEPSKLQCPDCDLSFINRRALAMHRRRHKDNKPKKKEFFCDTCGKVFNMKHQLKRHVLLHNDVKPYKCIKCSKSYARKDQLTSHMHSHKSSKPYECSYCKKGFNQLCSLKDHIRSHTGETPYLCSECGKGFTISSNLRQHMMRHTGLKPYACNMCPKTFCTKGQMTSHMTTHSGEHPYKCEECGAAFTKSNSLKKHSLIHLGVRPFVCETCNMRFTCKDHLKRHNRIHTGEKPYRCNHCERAFTQSNDLLKHMRSHVGQNLYQCTICSMRFRLLSELKNHYPVHFVDGKMQHDTKIDIAPPKPTSPTNDLSPLLVFKPPELPPTSFNKDMPLLLMNSTEEKDLPIKSSAPTGFETVTEVVTHDDKNRYTITINSCSKNGLVNGITIDIPPKDG